MAVVKTAVATKVAIEMLSKGGRSRANSASSSRNTGKDAAVLLQHLPVVVVASMVTVIKYSVSSIVQQSYIIG